jgi:hypothetical protein
LPNRVMTVASAIGTTGGYLAVEVLTDCFPGTAIAR